MTLFIQEAAERDILLQVEWSGREGRPDIARRFHLAVLNAIDALVAMPAAAPPKPASNPRLFGLRAWPVSGFDEFGVARDDRPIVVRVLHDKRDVAGILGDQDVDER